MPLLASFQISTAIIAKMELTLLRPSKIYCAQDTNDLVFLFFVYLLKRQFFCHAARSSEMRIVIICRVCDGFFCFVSKLRCEASCAVKHFRHRAVPDIVGGFQYESAFLPSPKKFLIGCRLRPRARDKQPPFECAKHDGARSSTSRLSAASVCNKNLQRRRPIQ